VIDQPEMWPFCWVDVPEDAPTMVNGNDGSGAHAPGLRAQRKAAKLSQERLAALAGCSTSMVKLLERGYDPERSDVLQRVLAILKSEDPGAGGRTEVFAKTAGKAAGDARSG
jgi:DNA-binding XRE family transcriptional regulator